MEITLDLPEELAAQLRPHQTQLPRILELGLRAMQASSPQTTFEEADEVLTFLASSPPPEQVWALRASPALQARLSFLLEKNRGEGLSESEEREWTRYEEMEHAVGIAKAKAHMKLQAARGKDEQH
jgi:hypothetical protein